MKKMILPMLSLLILLGLVWQVTATHQATATLAGPTSTSQLLQADAEPLEWPLQPSFGGGFVGSCSQCQTHADCVSVCGVPWAACIPNIFASCPDGGEYRFCSCD